jgi:hypothetical protein
MVQPKKTQSRGRAPRRQAGATLNRDTSSHISSRCYDRRVELPRILPLWPHELDDQSLEGRRTIVRKLRSALRAERRRGIAGHWTYDLARHAELVRIYRLELASSRLPGNGAENDVRDTRRR